MTNICSNIAFIDLNYSTSAILQTARPTHTYQKEINFLDISFQSYNTLNSLTNCRYLSKLKQQAQKYQADIFNITAKYKYYWYQCIRGNFVSLKWWIFSYKISIRNDAITVYSITVIARSTFARKRKQLTSVSNCEILFGRSCSFERVRV